MITKKSLLTGMVVLVGLIGLAGYAATTRTKPQPATVVTVDVAPHDNYVALADAAIQDKNWALAEQYLRVAFTNAADPYAITQSYLGVADHLTAEQTDKDQYDLALAVLQNARTMLDAVHQNLITDRQPLDQLTLLSEKLKPMRDRTQKQLDAAALAHIARADTYARNSYHYVWFNNRELVRQGLIELRWVNDYKDQINTDTRADYFHTLASLKARVSDKEWPSLLASAGIVFDEQTASQTLAAH